MNDHTIMIIWVVKIFLYSSSVYSCHLFLISSASVRSIPFLSFTEPIFCFIDYAKTFDCVHHNKLWKILKEMGIPDHMTCLLRNLYAGQEAELELDMEQQTGSK